MGSCLPCCSPTELTRQYTVSKMDSPGREEISYFLHDTPGMHGDLCSSTQPLLSIVSCPGYLSSTLNLISGVSWHPSPCAQSIRNVWAAFCPRKSHRACVALTASAVPVLSHVQRLLLFSFTGSLCRRRQPPSLNLLSQILAEVMALAHC